MIEEDTTKQPYSESLRHFADMLKASGFEAYEDALTHLEYIKKSDRSSSTKPKSQISLNETPTNFITPTTHNTPIG